MFHISDSLHGQFTTKTSPVSQASPEYKVFKMAAWGATISSRGIRYLKTDRGHFLVKKYVNRIR